MAAKTAAIKTLGCKLNQFESEQMREQLEQMGYRIVSFDVPADLYVLNSCMVTSRTARDCRRLCRVAKRTNPQALLVVTGCYAEVEPQAFKGLAAVDIVLGNAVRGRLAEFVPAASPGALGSPLASYTETGPMIRRMEGHTRAFVKVQEGCNARCAYCVIPYARGPSRSVPPGKVVEQVKLLLADGCPEVVLVGTHLGQYGGDLPENINLAGLVHRLCDLSELGRLRLSSIEPREITDQLIELVAAGGRSLSPDPHQPGRSKLCRHWHIPMQSGCDEILVRMNRPYDSAFYRVLVEKIKTAEPDTAIGADVIVGFPGETDDQFEQTRVFIESLPLTYLHVFTYSPRPQTSAAAMPDQIPGHVKKERHHILREISELKRAQFAETMLGKQLEAVVEQSSETEQGSLRALTDNYLRAEIDGLQELVGDIVKTQVTGATAAVLRGEPVK